MSELAPAGEAIMVGDRIGLSYSAPESGCTCRDPDASSLPFPFGQNTTTSVMVGHAGAEFMSDARWLMYRWIKMQNQRGKTFESP